MPFVFDRLKYIPGLLKYKIWYGFQKPKFKMLGRKSFIKSPLTINGHRNIEIGDNVLVGYKSWLAAVPQTGSSTCLLRIGNGSSIGNFNHIYATKMIVIGEKVLTADKVYISDNLHGYEEINLPIIDQPIKQIGEVYIGDGTWIGENVCILGVKIGKHCVVGANAVVTKDIPDYSIAVGNPARIIKQYDFKEKKWSKLI
jgi:acetyltransferase-like isoleucine patch superfamily enzyme